MTNCSIEFIKNNSLTLVFCGHLIEGILIGLNLSVLFDNILIVLLLQNIALDPVSLQFIQLYLCFLKSSQRPAIVISKLSIWLSKLMNLYVAWSHLSFGFITVADPFIHHTTPFWSFSRVMIYLLLLLRVYAIISSLILLTSLLLSFLCWVNLRAPTYLLWQTRSM